MIKDFRTFQRVPVEGQGPLKILGMRSLTSRAQTRVQIFFSLIILLVWDWTVSQWESAFGDLHEPI